MNDFKSRIKHLVVSQNATLDVRTDQCDIVRIAKGRVFAGIEQVDGAFVAKVSVFGEPDVFGTNHVESITDSTEEGVVASVLRAIKVLLGDDYC